MLKLTKTLFCGIIASNKWGGSMDNHEVEDLMVTTFLGYKYRKQHDLLYSTITCLARFIGLSTSTPLKIEI